MHRIDLGDYNTIGSDFLSDFITDRPRNSMLQICCLPWWGERQWWQLKSHSLQAYFQLPEAYLHGIISLRPSSKLPAILFLLLSHTWKDYYSVYLQNGSSWSISGVTWESLVNREGVLGFGAKEQWDTLSPWFVWNQFSKFSKTWTETSLAIHDKEYRLYRSNSGKWLNK